MYLANVALGAKPGRSEVSRRLQLGFQVLQERVLIGDELLARTDEIKPGGAIDFRKLPALARARRPLDLEHVADQFV